ncbi:branched-chain amino acid ABC transporter permease [Nitratireductor mangrovi]|uniref:Branched-chain amino acid ABC transporter permease n=1 Tax=Nitratireductor mangrovi TaxID=2599600 RepID=A0A5B8L423_9HYPH|nr:branched-chain amino acid ABC transporter permease [Nitratireductor mangrovi]QDZ02420.1 branched-chain amino acid ABC transporter permease [Nitratireductor mangrovi]
MGRGSASRVLALHLAVLAVLVALYFVLPDYHRGIVPRVLVLAVFAAGYNILFGYTGLLSLGHAMFFAAGIYGAGMPAYYLDWGVLPAFAAGIASGAVLALVVGFLALRTSGVAFMIVTMMFSQVFYLTTLYFTTWTRGEEGLVIGQQLRQFVIGGTIVDLTDPATRYFAAVILFGVVLFASLAVARAPFGRVLIAIRENEERVRMLGYDVFLNKLAAVVISGVFCAAAGAAYALLFGYVGSTFASIQYSILPLLWVLLGGAATTLGPLIGTVFMFYVVDITSGYTSAYLLIVGIALILLVLFFPKGFLGTVRERWLRWLP